MRTLILALGFLSFPSLVRAQMGELEFGEVSGEPGEIVALPVRATYDDPLRGFFVTYTFDATRLELFRFDISGSVATEFNALDAVYRMFESGEGLLGIFNGSTNLELEFRRIPPGERQLLGHLLFRVLATAPEGEAEVVIVERLPAAPGGTAFEMELEDGTFLVATPSEFVAGHVDVGPPSGPRPVAGLVCEQFLDRARLTFTPSDTYDSLEVTRGGATVATLEGGATDFTETLPGLGKFQYSITARRDDATSLAVSCELLAVSPSAPAITELACQDGRVLWTNPTPYDFLVVFRDGETVAQLPGDSTEFIDESRVSTQALYTVIGELEGFRSPGVHCLDPGIWLMELGDVQVSTDATMISLPVYITTSAPLRGWDSFIHVDTQRFAIVRSPRLALDGVVGHPEPEFIGIGISGATGFPATGVIWDSRAPNEPEKDLPVGLRQHALNYVFRPVGDFEEGDTFPVTFLDGSFSIRKDASAVSVPPNELVPGQIRFGSSGPPAVEGLEAIVGEAGDGAGAGGPAPGAKSVQLVWQNAGSYDALRIERNGEVIDEIGGTEHAYVDETAGNGIYTYKVVGLQGAESSFPASTFVSTFAPPGAFLRGDADDDGELGLSDPIVTLNFLFLGGSPLPCEDAADTDDSGQLDLGDAIVTLNYLFLGTQVIQAPGTRYAWFDPTTDGLTCAR